MLTNEQRNKVKAKALELGFTEEIAQKISTNAKWIVSLDTKESLLLTAFSWHESPEGVLYWEGVYFDNISKP